MRPSKKPWSEPALDDLMHEVAKDVKARAEAARERLANDPAERERVVELLSKNGFGLDENQELIRISEYPTLLTPGDLMRSYER